MKAILMSIKPKWCEKIFSGEKTVEVRKTAPQLATPFKVYVYETKAGFIEAVRGTCPKCAFSRGKVIGSFVCDKIDEFSVGSLASDDIQNESCLTYAELISYFYKQNELDGNTLKFGYGWHITAPKLYDKPRELGEFGRYETKLKLDVKGIETVIETYKEFIPLTRPPQSWMYVEEMTEESVMQNDRQR